MSTKQEIKKAERFLCTAENLYVQYFLNLAHNSINIKGLPDDVPKRYFLKVLFKNGKIGNYGGMKGVFLPVSGVGVDIYGLPTDYILTGFNGYVHTASAKEVGILRLNDLSIPLYPYIKFQARRLAEIDAAIEQNLNAVKTMTMYECKDQSTLLSLQNAAKARQTGAVCAFAVKGTLQDNIVVHETGAEYLCDKFTELRKEIMNETLSRLGVMTSNTDKRERVQTAEVNATVGVTVDNIYIMIDTFNYDAKISGLNLRMELNSVTEDYYKLSENNEKEGEDNARR